MIRYYVRIDRSWTVLLALHSIIISILIEPTQQQNVLGGELNYPPSETDVSCVVIPNSIKLCRGLEYSEMRLPNLLGHDTTSEVETQSRVWNLLLKKCCHPDLKLFLCSLFTPVCIKNNNTDMPFRPGVPIYPCRGLCESVKNKCMPVIGGYGFTWPKDFACNRFPNEEAGMCIRRQSTTMPRTCIEPDAAEPNNKSTQSTSLSRNDSLQCAPCDNENDIATLIDHFCANEFVIKVRIRKSKRYRRTDRKITVHRKAKFRTIYKPGSIMESDEKKMQLYMLKGMQCPCAQLEENKKTIRKDFFLIMGRKLEHKLLVTVLHRWPKRNKMWKTINRKFKSPSIC